MATKYNIERPCEDIVARIRAQWPATLSQHDAREAQHRAELAAARVPHPNTARPPRPNGKPTPNGLTHPLQRVG